MSGLAMNNMNNQAENFARRMDFTEISDRLSVMRKQEETTYCCYDYLYSNDQQQLCELHPSIGPQELQNKPVDEECRKKMCEWCYQVVDFCKFDRETAAIGLSYLDRYLGCDSGRSKFALSNRKEYQLAAMTTLYMAIKLFEPMEMDTSLLSELSRGCYTEAEIAEMESNILSALNWRVNGPTAIGFVHQMIALLPSTVAENATAVSTLLDFARFQTELSVSDYFFIRHRVSTVAIASILNAMEGIDYCLFPSQDRFAFLRAIAEAAVLNPFSEDVESVRTRLLNLFAKSSGCELSQITSTGSVQPLFDTTSKTVEHEICYGDASPVCVSQKTALYA